VRSGGLGRRLLGIVVLVRRHVRRAVIAA
jgi:hypothetical protein